MKSRKGKIQETYTSRFQIRYELEIWHDGLNKYQVIKGNERHVVKQKASAKQAKISDLRGVQVRLLINENDMEIPGIIKHRS